MPDQLAFSTSGTSGQRKYFALDRGQMAARIARLAVSKGPEFADLKSLFCFLTPSSTAATRYRLYCELAGVKLFTPLKTLAATMELLASEPIDGVIGWPADLLRAARELKGIRKFPYILAGGDRLGPATAVEIRDNLLAPGGAAYVTYGSSEGGTYTRGTFADAIAISGCVGRPIDGVSIEIEAGEVAIRSPTLIAGYADQALTAKHFRGAKFYPGDLAEFTGDGLLVLKGRV